MFWAPLKGIDILPSSLIFLRLRTLSLISICIVFMAGCLVWASRQQAGTASRRFSAAGFIVGQFVAEKGGITPAGTTIVVNSLSDVENGSDGLCTLREAITAANNDAASGGAAGECAAGNGTDTLDLTSLSGTITLATA